MLLLSIAIPSWYFFYLDLDIKFLIVGGFFCGALWATNRYAFINFEGADENPLVVAAMVLGGVGTLCSIISVAMKYL